MTRCKFTCTSKRQYLGWDGANSHAPLYEYEFTAVYSGDENKAFFAATPSGSLKVSVVRDGSFEVGRAYFIDLSPVPAAA